MQHAERRGNDMNRNTNHMPVDIVIPWVDDHDPKWKESMISCAKEEGRTVLSDSSDERYRDWNILKYLFRGITYYAPWVRKVHLITWGHLPEWLKTDAERLNIVNHKDYIPDEYLPTFSSHCIELNLHRIQDLSENFIYFNDDMLILKNLEEKMFFMKDTPCDYAILNAFISSHRYSVMDSGLTDIEIINDHFDKNQFIKHHLGKWFNFKYGTKMFRTVLMLPWRKVSYFYWQHDCVAYNKKTFSEVWEKEKDVLDATCRHHFRTRRDVNQWLMRAWRLAKGDFVPRSPKGFGYYVIGNDNTKIIQAVQSKKHSIICINDVIGQDIKNFNDVKEALIKCFDEAFPEKSEFEK